MNSKQQIEDKKEQIREKIKNLKTKEEIEELNKNDIQTIYNNTFLQDLYIELLLINENKEDK